jgi:diguanylate cyclase (GGDEF)-like protein
MASVLAEPFFQAESYDKNLSPITGIPNKAAYDLLLKQAPQGRLRCVYSIDMANLKVLNDGSSHDEADVVLKWYAEQLQKEASRLKEHALVQDAGAYHVHGDEFCVVVCAAQGVDEAAFTVQAQETLRKIAAIQYINKQKPSYPETYLRIGALCAPDADYKEADKLQNLVGEQLKREYPDRSRVCPLAGRCNYSFESLDVDGKLTASAAQLWNGRWRTHRRALKFLVLCVSVVLTMSAMWPGLRAPYLYVYGRLLVARTVCIERTEGERLKDEAGRVRDCRGGTRVGVAAV